jgi:hypothetical protein
MLQKDFVAELAKLHPSSTFLTLHGYRNEHSEVADYNIVFHISYENALKKSVSILDSYLPIDDLQAKAKTELLTSFKNSLTNIKETPIEEIDDEYTRFFSDGKYVKGVKMHTATGTLHLYGSVVNKKVIIPASYPKKNKRELTIAKDKLRRMCPVDKFRQFKILPENVTSISVGNLNLLPPE